MEEIRLAKKRQSSREYYYKNRKRVLARMRARHPAVREQKNAYGRAWNAQHSEEVSAKRKVQRRANVDNVIRIRVASAQKKAERKGLPFDITDGYVRQLYDVAPYCTVSKLPFDFSKKHSTLSIDRIVPAKGYVVGNVRLVRWQVNVALQNWGDAIFYQMVDAVAAQRTGA